MHPIGIFWRWGCDPPLFDHILLYPWICHMSSLSKTRQIDTKKVEFPQQIPTDPVSELRGQTKEAQPTRTKPDPATCQPICPERRIPKLQGDLPVWMLWHHKYMFKDTHFQQIKEEPQICKAIWSLRGLLR